MSNSNYRQCDIKSRIDRKTVLLRNSSVLGTIVFITTMRPVLWQTSAYVQQKTLLLCKLSSATAQLSPIREQCLLLRERLGGATVDIWPGHGVQMQMYARLSKHVQKRRAFFVLFYLCSLNQKISSQIFMLVTPMSWATP